MLYIQSQFFIFPGVKVQQKTNSFWNEVKSKPNCKHLVEVKIKELVSETASMLNRNSITRFLFQKRPLDSEKVSTITPLQSHSSNVTANLQPANQTENDQSSDSESDQEKCKVAERPAPKQTALKDRLFFCSTELDRLKRIRKLGLASDDIFDKIEKYSLEEKELKKSLKRLEKSVEYNRDSRRRKKAKFEKIQAMLPDQKIVKDKPGPWPIEATQPELLKTIADIVTSQSAADDKRRCSVLYTCRTLDDLHEALQERGFSLSRSSTYNRLVPKRLNSMEGKRHVTTVPVKLAKASANERQKHSDSHFATVTVNYLKELAVVLGSGPVFFLSQDDKCRVPIGLPAANKQAPFLMSMERRVRLPDHDFVVATRHKLIPSVYAAAKISESSVTYSGPTFITIRSGKHDSSNAASHASDFDRLFKLDDFADVMRMNDGKLKPVVIISVDGGPDENPRYLRKHLLNIHL